MRKWFDDQLHSRREADNRDFREALGSIADAVMGSRLQEALSQAEIEESALDEILKFFHIKPGHADIPGKTVTADRQIDFYSHQYGIRKRKVVLDRGWYKNSMGPMLGTLAEDGSLVSLIPGRFSGYVMTDFKNGLKVKLNKKTEELIDSEAVLFYPSLPQRALTLKDLIAFTARRFRLSDVIFYFILMFLSSCLGLLGPRLTKWLFGDVLESGSAAVLVSLAVFMVSYSLGNICFGTFRMLISQRLRAEQDIAVEAAVVNRLLSLPPSFFRDYQAGDLSYRSSYFGSLCSMLVGNVAESGLSALFSLIYIWQIFEMAPSMAAPALLISGATVVISLAVTFMQMNVSKRSMELSAQTSGLTYSIITGIQKIKLAGAEKRAFARWGRQYSKEARLYYNPPLFIRTGSVITLFISLAGTLILYSQAIKGNLDASEYYAFNASYALLSSAFMSLASLAGTFAEIRPAIEILKPILNAEPESAEGKEFVTGLKGGLELSHVSFRYDEDMPWVIDDLSLKIKPGEYLVIAGKTGCGKSTLMRLLLGFEKPQRGTIYFDGNDINKVDTESLRQHIGTVMQDGKLFLGDIYSNISITAPGLSTEKAWKAAEAAAIADDIRALPMGMKTIIAEGQGGISGGQRQRLMIARALAPEPEILMFDEATSALDNITQKKISDAIGSLNCTRIVIAHRLSTIKNADRIICLENGKIAESGTYEELIAEGGFFAGLVERQRLDVDL